MIRLRLSTAEERAARKRERNSAWHKWFAWHPVRLQHDVREIRWLGTIYRKGKECYDEGDTWWEWKYAETSLDILKPKDESTV